MMSFAEREGEGYQVDLCGRLIRKLPDSFFTDFDEHRRNFKYATFYSQKETGPRAR